MVLAGCNNPAGGGSPAPSNTGDTPTLTDIKVVDDLSKITSGPFLTTLSSGTTYYVLFFASDQDKDVTKIVIDYTKNGAFVQTEEVSVVVGMTLVTEALYGELTPSEAGTWKAEAYLEDAKGHKSSKKSITVTVN
jgi:hypothetical protein